MAVLQNDMSKPVALTHAFPLYGMGLQESVGGEIHCEASTLPLPRGFSIVIRCSSNPE